MEKQKLTKEGRALKEKLKKENPDKYRKMCSLVKTEFWFNFEAKNRKH